MASKGTNIVLNIVSPERAFRVGRFRTTTPISVSLLHTYPHGCLISAAEATVVLVSVRVYTSIESIRRRGLVDGRGG